MITIFKQKCNSQSSTPIFREKKFSNMVDGAWKGATIGTIAAGVPIILSKNGKNNFLGKLGEKIGLSSVGPYTGRKDKDGNAIDSEYTKYSDEKQSIQNTNKLILTTGATLVGAALGALVGGIKDFAHFVSKKSVGSGRMSDKIVDNLVRMGYKGGKDFTLNPKLANTLKLKVCVSVSRVNLEVKMIINTINDKNLQKIASEVTKNLPKSATATETVGDRFNNLVITRMSSVEDPAFVSGILEQFIRGGYPVYIVEVG